MEAREHTNDVASRLASVAWDFSRARTNTGPHRIHPYPARFNPQIPQKLIELFHPGDGTPVLDPFCGSGTTLVEAASANLPAVGIDLHPLATLIAKVKNTAVPGCLNQIAGEICRKAREKVERRDVKVPYIPRLDHWFRKDIQLVLAALISEIDSVDDHRARDALKVAFSSMVVRVSNQESDTRYAAVKKNLSQETVWKIFARNVENTALALENVGGDLFRKEPQVKVITQDIMQVTPTDVGNNIGLVITSPPYPNAYEYWLYHKYRMYWLQAVAKPPLACKRAI